MRYFIDAEFVEGSQEGIFFKTMPTIDLISLGIVAEDSREYYAVSNQFNLREAWDRYDGEDDSKVYWLRENVLRPIWVDFEVKYLKEYNPVLWVMNQNEDWKSQINYTFFTYKRFKYLLNLYGTSRSQIAEEVVAFVNEETDGKGNVIEILGKKTPIEFYAYYGDYDWVVFCWLFGKMKDLPKGFPCYAKDLQQIFDEKKSLVKGRMKDQPGFPVNEGIHNALEDARWNSKLFEFLKKL